MDEYEAQEYIDPDITDYVRTDESLPYYEYTPSTPVQDKTPEKLSSSPPAPPVQPPAQKSRRVLYSVLGIMGVLLVIAAGGYTFFSTQAALKSAHQQQSSPTTFQMAKCPFTPGSGIVEGKVLRCGTLRVPEDRNNPSGRKIQLAIAIFSPPASNHVTPLLYLEGGPGGSALDNLGSHITAKNIARVTMNRDLILFDQRGTGYSRPELSCYELDDATEQYQKQNLSVQAEQAAKVNAMQKCRNRLAAFGFNFNAYTTIDNAKDVDAVIHALNYKQVDLYGVSYGTRLALTVMRLFPGDLRSVVLDSTVPMQFNLFDQSAALTQHAFDTLFQGCAASKKCNQSYPHLDRVFYQLVTQLNEQPVTIQDAQYGSISMNGDKLADWLYKALYITEIIPKLPETIFQMSQNDETLITQLYIPVLNGGEGLGNEEEFSDGMYFSVECGEDMAFTSLQKLEQEANMVEPAIKSTVLERSIEEFEICQRWNVQAVPTVQKQAVVSALPTLVLSGEYDPITPLSNAKLAMQTLKHGMLFSFPATGHGVFLTDSCPDGIISAFLQDPMTKPDGACIGEMPEPDFL